MALLVAILIETFGLWFLNTHMTIPADRLAASCWVLHFSVIHTFIALTFTPYNAAVISHEKMSIYAYVSILEGCIKLAIAYLIALDVWADRLIFYSGAMCFSYLFISLVYLSYCISHFEECRLRFTFDKSLFQRIGTFTGWNLVGSVSALLKDQGVNLLFNIFLGPAVNAARGVSNQASGIAGQFSNGFMQAITPQLTKSFASGNHHYMYTLVNQGTRMGFFLFFLIALPVFIETDTIMSLWLVNVPVHTVAFIRITLIILMLDQVISNPLITIMLATGKIKNYQLVVGGLQLLSFPLAYIMLKLGATPELVMIAVSFICCCCLVTRIHMLHNMIGFPVKSYLKNVLAVIALVILIASILPTIVYVVLPKGYFWSLIVCATAILSASFTIWFIGLTHKERDSLKVKIADYLPFLKNKPK